MPHGHARTERVTSVPLPTTGEGRRHLDGKTRRKHSFTTMTILEMKGDWNITKGKLKQKWAQLTDNDLDYIEGREDELFGRIQKATGETRQAVEKALRDANFTTATGRGCD